MDEFKTLKLILDCSWFADEEQKKKVSGIYGENCFFKFSKGGNLKKSLKNPFVLGGYKM